MSKLRTFINLMHRLVAIVPALVNTKYKESPRAQKTVHIIVIVLKFLGKIALTLLVVLGHILTIFAMINTNEVDDKEEDDFIRDHNNHMGGVKVGNKHYSEDQARSNFQNGKFYDKY